MKEKMQDIITLEGLFATIVSLEGISQTTTSTLEGELINKITLEAQID